MRAVRARLFFIVIACLSTYIVFKVYPESFMGKEAMVLAILSVMVLVHCFYRIAPMRHILARIEALQERLPHERKLDLIYRKDEFHLVEEMLTLTENQLKEQRESFENQQIQSDMVLDYIPNAVVIVDKFKNCKRFNRRFEKKFVQGKNALLVDQVKLWKVFENSEILPAFEKTLATGERSLLAGIRIGETNEYFDVSIAPVQDNKGQLTGALGIFHNVTQAKLTEKMRVDFVANVSHEIRTPLTSIKGYAQLLAAHKDSLPAQLPQVLEKINNNTERLKDLFDNLLKLSVIESSNELKSEFFDFKDLIAQISARLRGKYLNKNFEIKLETDELKVWGDKKLLDQVFSNLVDNALKYSDKESSLVSIRARELGQELHISVRDNGSGFSSTEADRIFERFYRIQGQSAHPVEGSGLGLSIVKHILAKHGGSIKASSEKGEGSTFTVCLPKMAEC